MRRTERIRQAVAEPLSPGQIQKFENEGWKLVAVEWEREIREEPKAASLAHHDPPFGLRVAADAPALEENPQETDILVAMMELIIQDGPYSAIAQELNRRGYRTRDGQGWTPVAVFELLPRLIDAGPRILSTEQWRRYRQEHQHVSAD